MDERWGDNSKTTRGTGKPTGADHRLKDEKLTGSESGLEPGKGGIGSSS